MKAWRDALEKIAACNGGEGYAPKLAQEALNAANAADQRAPETPCCTASDPEGYVCTLPSDHAGDHEAHDGMSDAPVTTWSRRESAHLRSTFVERGDDSRLNVTVGDQVAVIDVEYRLDASSPWETDQSAGIWFPISKRPEIIAALDPAPSSSGEQEKQ